MTSAYYRFDDYTLMFDVFAVKDIKPGEELTFSCKITFPLLLSCYQRFPPHI